MTNFNSSSKMPESYHTIVMCMQFDDNPAYTAASDSQARSNVSICEILYHAKLAMC